MGGLSLATKKKILIISSHYTGHGHKSITESLCEQFATMDDIDIAVIDGFDLAGQPGVRLGKFYGTITRNAKDVWGMIFNLTTKHPETVNSFTVPVIKTKLVNYIKKYKPDAILSVHPNFVGSVLNILQEDNIKLPFVTLLADLVSISSLWVDPRADYTICPTIESKEVAMSYGVPEERIKILSFPVRQRFTQDGRVAGSLDFKEKGIPTFLIMSGGEGSGNMLLIARALLRNFDCKVRILAGRNKSLKKRLESWKAEHEEHRLEIFGFLDNVQDVMLTSDVAVMRGSPNTIMEAVNCCLPAIITGALPGQEEGNPEYFANNGLAVISTTVKSLKTIVRKLLAKNGEQLWQLKNNQKSFRNLSAARDIAEFMRKVANTK